MAAIWASVSVAPPPPTPIVRSDSIHFIPASDWREWNDLLLEWNRKDSADPSLVRIFQARRDAAAAADAYLDGADSFSLPQTPQGALLYARILLEAETDARWSATADLLAPHAERILGEACEFEKDFAAILRAVWRRDTGVSFTPWRKAFLRHPDYERIRTDPAFHYDATRNAFSTREMFRALPTQVDLARRADTEPEPYVFNIPEDLPGGPIRPSPRGAPGQRLELVLSDLGFRISSERLRSLPNSWHWRERSVPEEAFVISLAQDSRVEELPSEEWFGPTVDGSGRVNGTFEIPIPADASLGPARVEIRVFDETRSVPIVISEAPSDPKPQMPFPPGRPGELAFLPYHGSTGDTPEYWIEANGLRYPLPAPLPRVSPGSILHFPPETRRLPPDLPPGRHTLHFRSARASADPVPYFVGSMPPATSRVGLQPDADLWRIYLHRASPHYYENPLSEILSARAWVILEDTRFVCDLPVPPSSDSWIVGFDLRLHLPRTMRDRTGTVFLALRTKDGWCSAGDPAHGRIGPTNLSGQAGGVVLQAPGEGSAGSFRIQGLLGPGDTAIVMFENDIRPPFEIGYTDFQGARITPGEISKGKLLWAHVLLWGETELASHRIGFPDGSHAALLHSPWGISNPEAYAALSRTVAGFPRAEDPRVERVRIRPEIAVEARGNATYAPQYRDEIALWTLFDGKGDPIASYLSGRPYASYIEYSSHQAALAAPTPVLERSLLLTDKAACDLGHSVATALRRAGQVKEAVVNRESFRGNLPRGPLSPTLLQAAYPFPNRVLVIRLSPENLRAARAWGKEPAHRLDWASGENPSPIEEGLVATSEYLVWGQGAVPAFQGAEVVRALPGTIQDVVLENITPLP